MRTDAEGPWRRAVERPPLGPVPFTAAERELDDEIYRLRSELASYAVYDREAERKYLVELISGAKEREAAVLAVNHSRGGSPFQRLPSEVCAIIIDYLMQDMYHDIPDKPAITPRWNFEMRRHWYKRFPPPFAGNPRGKGSERHQQLTRELASVIASHIETLACDHELELELRHAVNLRHLDVRDRGGEREHAGLTTPLWDTLVASCTGLRSAWVSSHHRCDSDVALFSPGALVLPRFSNLRLLTIRAMRFTAVACFALFDGLADLEHLESLDVSSCTLALLPFLSSSKPYKALSKALLPGPSAVGGCLYSHIARRLTLVPCEIGVRQQEDTDPMNIANSDWNAHRQLDPLSLLPLTLTIAWDWLLARCIGPALTEVVITFPFFPRGVEEYHAHFDFAEDHLATLERGFELLLACPNLRKVSLESVPEASYFDRFGEGYEELKLAVEVYRQRLDQIRAVSVQRGVDVALSGKRGYY